MNEYQKFLDFKKQLRNSQKLTLSSEENEGNEGVFNIYQIKVSRVPL